MCKFKSHFLVALLTFGIGVSVIGIWRDLSAPQSHHENNYIQPQISQISQENIDLTADKTPNDIKQKTIMDCAENETHVYFQGISFVCNSYISSQIEVREYSQSPLQDKNDKPDYVHSSYISFRFQNGEQTQANKTGYFNQISIYPIEEYRQMYSIVGSQGIDECIDSLKKDISKKHNFDKHDSFFTETDGSFAFKSHLKYFSFKNGEGRGFVTQVTIEPTIINNQELIYVFEGITKDGKYYIQATFPIRAKFLPDSASDEFEGYSTRNYSSFTKRYDQYILSIRRRLDALPVSQYQPNLSSLIQIVSSVEAK